MVWMQSASLSSPGRSGAPGPTGAEGSNGTNVTRSGSAASGSGVSGVSFSTGRRLQAFVGNAVPASILERPGGSEQLQVGRCSTHRCAYSGMQKRSVSTYGSCCKNCGEYGVEAEDTFIAHPAWQSVGMSSIICICWELLYSGLPLHGARQWRPGKLPHFDADGVDMQDMHTSEVERNAQLGIQHAERLAAHGYRQVRPS